jgi:hypothetical protein
MNERTIEIVDELAGIKCSCGKVKRARQSFCRGCYSRLPPEFQKALYQRLEDGYVEAYENALHFLNSEARA